MRILIANDDGIYSPALLVLAEVASRFGEVVIVAPDVEQSSMGHAVTLSRPLEFKHTKLKSFEAFRVNGTPADCVALGLYQRPDTDVVFSGINMGHNLGNGLWHSGTLAAAKQAVLLDKRGIAFSAPAYDSPDEYETLKPAIHRVLQQVLPLSGASLLNVNFPAQASGEILWTKQSVRHYDGQVLPAQDPLGRPHFWFIATPKEGAEEGTDRWAIQSGFVSITPLRLDLTDTDLLAKQQRQQAHSRS